jgi:hypothetical protein
MVWVVHPNEILMLSSNIRRFESFPSSLLTFNILGDRNYRPFWHSNAPLVCAPLPRPGHYLAPVSYVLRTT